MVVGHRLGSRSAAQIHVLESGVGHTGAGDGDEVGGVELVARLERDGCLGARRGFDLEDAGGVAPVDLVPDGGVGELLGTELQHVGAARRDAEP